MGKESEGGRCGVRSGIGKMVRGKAFVGVFYSFSSCEKVSRGSCTCKFFCGREFEKCWGVRTRTVTMESKECDNHRIGGSQRLGS